jgi:nucleoside 2-deoxyribosyltransferase
MKKIFICAPNRYKEKTKSLASKLKKLGFLAEFAAENTNQNLRNKEIFDSNLKLIKNSDVFLAYFVNDGHYGIDFSIEVGKASEMNKPVIGFVDMSKEKLNEFKKRLEKDIMFKHSFDSFAWKFEELMGILKVSKK